MSAERPPQSERNFTLFIASLALLVSIGALLAVAFRMNHNGTGVGAMSGASMPMRAATHMRAAGYPAVGTAVENLRIDVKSDEEHGKMGADGNWHDAFLPADFSVKPGSLVRVTVYNYDEGAHTFTSPGLGTDVTIAAGSESQPAITTFILHAPQKAGRYEWFCALPCDPWAMNHDGFMRGFVTVA